MADEELAEDTQALNDLNAGFDSQPPPPAKPAQGEEQPKPAAEVEPKTPDKDPPPAAPQPKAPEYVQITKDEHATLMAAAAKTASFEGQFSKVFGALGNVKQLVERLQTQTPAGEKVELPKVAFAKLRESFPEDADLMEADRAKTLKDLRGTGPADAPGATLSTEEVQKTAKAMVVAIQSEALEED